MKHSKKIIVILLIILFVESGIIVQNTIDKNDDNKQAMRIIKNGIDDGINIFAVDYSQLNDKDRLRQYAKAIAGIEVARKYANEIERNSRMKQAIYLIQDYLHGMDLTTSDNWELDLYNVII